MPIVGRYIVNEKATELMEVYIRLQDLRLLYSALLYVLIKFIAQTESQNCLYIHDVFFYPSAVL